jgi:repressor LexA
MKKLHPTQIKLLEILKKNIAAPLTIREIQEELFLSSTSVVHHHLQQLEKKGYLKRNPMNSGDYQILSDSESQITFLNLYGLAECGPDGRILDGNPIDRIPVSTKMLGFPSSDAFMVKAHGDSMVPKINDGDMIIAIKSNDASDGSIVVCVNNGKALIKKIEKHNDKIILTSFNEEFLPIVASREYFFIEGIVKKVLSDVL